MRIAGIFLPLALAAAPVAASGQPVASGRWEPQAYAVGPAANPLKGFLPYRGEHTTFPHRMEFGMVPWRALQCGPADFTWEPLEQVLDDIASRGHSGRVPDLRRRAEPAAGAAGVPVRRPRRAYSDFDNGCDATSAAPDYDDPRLVDAMRRTIAALGAR